MEAYLQKGILADPFYFLFFLIGLSLLPFIAIMTTSFAKIAVVLSIARHALGTPQSPPNLVIISLSLILTAFSMYPVINKITNNFEQNNIKNSSKENMVFLIINSAKDPLKEFMNKHTKEEDKRLFLNVLLKNDQNSLATIDDFIILAPAFLVSELSLAFQIGFLVFLPFVVIDLIIANLLMALGMQMLSPTTISLPFKILLFILVDGWRLLVEGLIKV